MRRALRTCRSRPGGTKSTADWRLMLGEGRAFGMPRCCGRTRIASALVLPLGPAISWISMVLVTKPARRLGVWGLASCSATSRRSRRRACRPASMRRSWGGRSICRWDLPTCTHSRDGVPRRVRAGQSKRQRASGCGPQRRRTGADRRRATRPARASPAATSSRTCSRGPRPLASVAERADGTSGYALRPQRSQRHAHRPGCG